MAHVSQKKKDIVKKIKELASEYPIIGAVNMANLPAKQLQSMREQLRGKVRIFMTKRRLMKVAFEALKDKVKNLEALKPHLEGMPALIFTRENPFALFRITKRNKSKAPAKGGQTAPSDIKVSAGPTSFAPGPIIGELGAFGIKTQVDAGKLQIIKDTVVCEKGQVISPKLAEMLTRLGIMPMEIGLDLTAILEEGTVYTKDVLDVDEEAFAEGISQAAVMAFNLAFEISFPAKETLEPLIAKAFNDAKGLAMEAGILTKETAEMLLAKAHTEMMSLRETAKIETPAKSPGKAEAPAENASEAAGNEDREAGPEAAGEGHEKKEGSRAGEDKGKGESAPEQEKDTGKAGTGQEKGESPEAAQPDGSGKGEGSADGQGGDDSVSRLVEETKKFAEGKIPKSEELVEEAKKEESLNGPQDKEKKKAEEVPSIQELAEKQKKGK